MGKRFFLHSFAAVLCGASSVMLSAQDYVVISANAVNLRKAPSVQAAKYSDQLCGGALYELKRNENGWMCITYGGKDGYVNEMFGVRVTPSPIPEQFWTSEEGLSAVYDDQIRTTTLYVSKLSNGMILLYEEALRMSLEGNPLPAEMNVYIGRLDGNTIEVLAGTFGSFDTEEEQAEIKRLLDENTYETPMKAFWDAGSSRFYFNGNAFKIPIGS